MSLKRQNVSPPKLRPAERVIELLHHTPSPPPRLVPVIRYARNLFKKPLPPSTTLAAAISASARPPLSGALFARHFLDEGIRQTSAWRALGEEPVRALRDTLRMRVFPFQGHGSPNEATTEQELILPVLEALGWQDTLPQQAAGGRGRADVPDWLLFASAEAKAAAMAEPREEDRYRHGTTFLEAKRWLRPLDRGENGAAPDPGTPAAQMLRYLSRAEVASDRRIRWGMLTNGRHWRLYWQGARSRSEEYFEVDLAAIAAGDDADDHLARVFLLLFRREAFLPAEDPRGRPFLHVAQEESHDWEERVSRDLGRRVFADVFPRLLDALVRNDPTAPDPPHPAYLGEVRRDGLTFLYRLLFVLYAEDRRLLPAGDQRYDRYSLLRLRREIERRIDGGETLSARACGDEQRLRDLFRAIGEGDPSIGLPAYDSALFDRGGRRSSSASACPTPTSRHCSTRSRAARSATAATAGSTTATSPCSTWARSTSG